MSLLEQNIIKKRQGDKNLTKIKAGSNDKKYMVEKI